MSNTVVVTRHESLVEYLREKGLVRGDVEVVAHATPDVIRGRHVVGVLPLHLAALCDRVTVVPLDLPPELRGRELNLEEVRAHAGAAQTFRVETL